MTWETDLNQSIADSETAIAQAPTPNCNGDDIVNDAYNLKVAELNSKITDLRAAYDAGIPPTCVPAPLSDPDLFSRNTYQLGAELTIGTGYQFQDLSGICGTSWGNVLVINETGDIHELTPLGALVKSISLINYPYPARDIEGIVHIAGTDEFWIIDESTQPTPYTSSAIKVTIAETDTVVDCTSAVTVPLGARGMESGWHDPEDNRCRFINRKPIDFDMVSILPDNTTILNDPFEPDSLHGVDRIHSSMDADLNENITPNPVIITGSILEEIDRADGTNVGSFDGSALMSGKIEGLVILDNGNIMLCKEASTNHIIILTAVPI